MAAGWKTVFIDRIVVANNRIRIEGQADNTKARLSGTGNFGHLKGKPNKVMVRYPFPALGELKPEDVKRA